MEGLLKNNEATMSSWHQFEEFGEVSIKPVSCKVKFLKDKGPKIIYSSYSHNWSVWPLQNPGNGERVFCERFLKCIFPIKFLAHGTKQQPEVNSNIASVYFHWENFPLLFPSLSPCPYNMQNFNPFPRSQCIPNVCLLWSFIWAPGRQGLFSFFNFWLFTAS